MGKVEVRCEWCRKPVLVAEAHIAELEAQVSYEQERNALNVAQHTDRIKELEVELAQLRAAFAKRKVEFLTIEHDLVDVDVIKRLEAELALMRSEEPTRVEMQDEIIRLQSDISRLRDIIASLESEIAVKDARIKALEGR